MEECSTPAPGKHTPKQPLVSMSLGGFLSSPMIEENMTLYRGSKMWSGNS